MSAYTVGAAMGNRVARIAQREPCIEGQTVLDFLQCVGETFERLLQLLVLLHLVAISYTCHVYHDVSPLVRCRPLPFLRQQWVPMRL